ncbi:phosphoribosyltransferase family protein [Sulfurimonas sp. C5]|uniref:phosphoribosyltransferase n=1 Tax=Sulfurimonas sp. C5 TaxID=3036947 RepID=UPI002455E213|nr:phosphoribosyltransferase family protein [Sulfurimonas sp. C5]MDH4944581.1 phosphoribosyltransferase family protein [Sulfurimonas sp. C5]
MKYYKEILQNREDAARKLAEVIPMNKLKDEQWELVGISKGGLVLGSYLKSRVKNRLDILLLEPIMAPNNPECEVARVSETEEIVIQENLIDSFEIKLDYIYGEAHRKHEEGILSKIYKFRKGRPFPSMKDKIVLLVDEGSETGTKFMTAVKTVLAQSPKAVYIAVPVIPSDVLETLEPFVDDIFFLYDIDDYVETELYYKKLEKVDDETVEKILEENK